MEKLEIKDIKRIVKERKGKINGLIQNAILGEEFLQVTTFPKDSKGINLFVESIDGDLVVNVYNLAIAHSYLTDSIDMLDSDDKQIPIWFKSYQINKINNEIGKDIRLEATADIRSLEYIIGSNITKERMVRLKNNIEYLGQIGLLQRKELNRTPSKKLVK